MATVKLDPEWHELSKMFPQVLPPVITDIAKTRKDVNAMIAAGHATLQVSDGIKETKHAITSVDGTSINVHRFVPAAVAAAGSTPQRAILYSFGGGMIAGNVDTWRMDIKDLADRTESQVFAVDYRLAPEHPAPAAVEDVYSAAKWLQEHASEFNVDPKRVVMHGRSAGGGITAGTALMIRDKGDVQPPAALVLRYPMLDDRTVVPADHPVQPYLTWTSAANDYAWRVVLGNEREDRTDENVTIYGAPARAKDLSGLPDTFIDTSALDLFVNEDTEFARRLTAAGVWVEFHLYPGVAHGFDAVKFMRVSKEAIASEENFIKRY
ncbi:Alpha/Beta hydrolase protein [Nemania sp. FL0916]|nr:Alpha/Beta hydrolase protein [Nemania sp. FL0916]